jgi:hypothetical protein
MVWTDSQDYGADEILYIARTALFNKTNQLIREIIILFEVYPQLFLTFSKGVSLDFPSIFHAGGFANTSTKWGLRGFAG